MQLRSWQNWHFQMYFHQCKCLNFDKEFTEVSSQGSSWQYSSIGSENCLAPNRRQAIIWTNDVLGCRRIYASFGLHVLISRRQHFKYSKTCCLRTSSKFNRSSSQFVDLKLWKVVERIIPVKHDTIVIQLRFPVVIYCPWPKKHDISGIHLLITAKFINKRITRMTSEYDTFLSAWRNMRMSYVIFICMF